MKKTIIKPDGSSETVEGTPQEIADYERKIKGEVQNEAPKPKTPGLLTDEMKRLFESVPQPIQQQSHSLTCDIVIAQRGWWSVVPPRCTCGLFTYPFFPDINIGTWSSTNIFRTDDGVIFPGCMGRPRS